MPTWTQGEYKIVNPQKYISKKLPKYKSSWEQQFMVKCDLHPNILQWGYEAIHIPYVNPLTGRSAVYIPDFYLVYVDKNGKQHAEIVEIKPAKEASIEKAKTKRDMLNVAINQSKWLAAEAWCKANRVNFRVMTEESLFRNPGKKK